YVGRDESPDQRVACGRIYSDRSDLSPDGRHMIYFAMGGVAWAIPATGTWTAISRLPSLKASMLWAQGDTRSGGGSFTSSQSYWLELDANTTRLRDEAGMRREEYRPAQSCARTDTPPGTNCGTER
ncbi:MAG: hypothetical protein JWP63_3163, partial [Candidatus Solibacter sp.]|nr:hypothetical protein [Candidatus Solibacter sp.]